MRLGEIYMIGPFAVKYGMLYNEPELFGMFGKVSFAYESAFAGPMDRPSVPCLVCIEMKWMKRD